MKSIIPKFDNQKDLFDYLRANKSKIIAEKCHKNYNHISDYEYEVIGNKTTATKATLVKEVEEPNLLVKLIGNTYNWCDSQMDVLLAGCAKKTIAELGPKGKDLIYHLKDHAEDSEGIVGYITDIYEEEKALTDLGLSMVGSTTCLMFESEVKEELCSRTYTRYKDKKVKQHSIGLKYIKILMCVNDPNDQEHFSNWNKYYQMVLNKEKVNASGFFWVVPELKLYEVSAVMWGSNELTPTEEVIEDSATQSTTDESKAEPIIFTQQKEEPQVSTLETISYIRNKKFI
jgi:hypothetical protein